MSRNVERVNNNIDSHLLPDDPVETLLDWQGKEVSPTVWGYYIDEKFVEEEDVYEYLTYHYAEGMAGNLIH